MKSKIMISIAKNIFFLDIILRWKYRVGPKEYSKDKLYLIDTIKTEQDIYQKICEELFLIN